MSMHHHRGAVANEDSVNWTLREETGKRVVVTRNHRKLAPLGFCAEKVHAAHGDSASLGLLKRYPTQGSLTMYSGLAGFFSIFLRSVQMHVRRYSSSPPYSRPQTDRSSFACVSRTSVFFIMTASRPISLGER